MEDAPKAAFLEKASLNLKGNQQLATRGQAEWVAVVQLLCVVTPGLARGLTEVPGAGKAAWHPIGMARTRVGKKRCPETWGWVGMA